MRSSCQARGGGGSEVQFGPESKSALNDRVVSGEATNEKRVDTTDSNAAEQEVIPEQESIPEQGA